MMHALTTRSVYFLNNVHVRSTESIYSICIPKLSHIWILHTSIHSKCTSIYRKRSSFSDTHQSPQYRVWMHIIQTIQSLKWPKLQGVKNYADRNSWTTVEKKKNHAMLPYAISVQHFHLQTIRLVMYMTHVRDPIQFEFTPCIRRCFSPNFNFDHQRRTINELPLHTAPALAISIHPTIYARSGSFHHDPLHTVTNHNMCTLALISVRCLRVVANWCSGHYYSLTIQHPAHIIWLWAQNVLISKHMQSLIPPIWVALHARYLYIMYIRVL